MAVLDSTKIKTVEGFIPIAELENKEIDVYCKNDDGSLFVSTLRNVTKVEKQKILMRVITTRGTLICTPDQNIFTINRGYVKARSLHLDDRVVGLNRKMQGEQKIFVGLTSEKSFRSEHRFIAGFYWDIKNKDVHHIDGNHMNNYKSNLEPLDHNVHSRITNWNHQDWSNRGPDGKFTSKPFRKPKDTYRLTENRTGKRYKLVSIEYVDNFDSDLFEFTVDKVNNLLADEIIISGKI